MLKQIFGKLLLFVATIFGIVAVFMYFDSIFIHIFSHVKYIFLYITAFNICGILLFLLSKGIRLSIRVTDESEQSLLDRQYKIRKNPAFLALIVGIPFSLFAVVSFLIGAFTDEGVYFFHILSGLFQIGVASIGYAVSPNNRNFCKNCHRKMTGARWNHDSSTTEKESKNKHYFGGHEKVGYLKDDKGNSVDVYRKYEGGSYRVERDVTTWRSSRKCPFCGYVHHNTMTTTTKWK